jgi:SSS family solute:Na+ symporter
MAARVLRPGLTDPNAVLPYVLTRELSPWLGAIALSAVFSTEVDTSDAVLFMLATSLSQDLYKRHVNPTASDAMLLRVARLSAVAGGTLGVLFSIALPTVIEGLSIFYSLLGVTLLVPVVGGLFVPRAGARDALASIAAGVIVWIALRYGVHGIAWLDPTLFGLVAAAIAFAVSLAFPGRPLGRPESRSSARTTIPIT